MLALAQKLFRTTYIVKCKKNIEIKQLDEQKWFEISKRKQLRKCHVGPRTTKHGKVQLNLCIMVNYSHLSMSSRLIKLVIRQDR